MARGATIAWAGAQTTASRAPSLPTLVLGPRRLSGEAFNSDVSRNGSEDTVPDGARWWTERIERYVASRTGVSENWRKQTRRLLRSLALPCGLARYRKDPIFVRLGFEAPTSAKAVSRAMIEALRDTPEFAPTSRQNWTSRL